MAGLGTRGKWSEGKVRDWMKVRNDTDAHFAFLRYPDARAGSAQPAPSDFEAMHRGVGYKIEVKEVKITTVSSRRLPSANFASDKVGRMRKWHLAGAACWVIVCHLKEGRGGVKEWRLVQGSHFFERAASWDLTHIQPYPSLDALMLQLFP